MTKFFILNINGELMTDDQMFIFTAVISHLQTHLQIIVLGLNCKGSQLTPAQQVKMSF